MFADYFGAIALVLFVVTGVRSVVVVDASAKEAAVILAWVSHPLAGVGQFQT